jgi:hypothetical protein
MKNIYYKLIEMNDNINMNRTIAGSMNANFT